MNADPLSPQVFKIVGKVQESADVFTLSVKPNSGLFSYRPGQFNMLRAMGIGESAISISSAPRDEVIKHTIRTVGPVTRHLCQLKPGDNLYFRGPFGTDWPLPHQAKKILIIAGGIGIAPLRPLIYNLLQAGYAQPITLIYGARTPADLIFQTEMAHWNKVMQVLLTVDQAPIDWRHHVGVVTTLIPQVLSEAAQTLVYLCGPEIMMKFCIYALKERGVLAENIFLSMERNMQCAIGQCGHCQWGPFFICRQGPVMNYRHIEPFFLKKEL